VGIGFRKKIMLNKELERDDDSKKNHPALVGQVDVVFRIITLSAAVAAAKIRIIADTPVTSCVIGPAIANLLA
jgi:hypothetical protein